MEQKDLNESAFLFVQELRVTWTELLKIILI